MISINTIHNLDRDQCAIALQEIERVSKKGSFITVDAYRNEEEKERMFAWNLTAKTIMSTDEWVSFEEVGYTGDYFLVYAMNIDISKELLFQMKRIRVVEEEIARRYPEGEMRCPTHLSVGQKLSPLQLVLRYKMMTWLLVDIVLMHTI